MKKTLITVALLASLGVAYAANSGLTAKDRERSPEIAVNAPDGTSFRLVYAADKGWRFADRYGPKLASTSPAQGLTGAVQALPVEIPQTVFVDGPTGFVFAYVGDAGWRFLGSVADTKR